MAEPTQLQRDVFGHDVQLHPLTGMVLEQGSGALPPHQQARLHCVEIEKLYGKKAADVIRKRLDDEDSAMRKRIEADGARWLAQLELLQKMEATP